MKKITLLILIAIVPFLSIAQKRSSKKTVSKQEVKVQLSEYEYMNITGLQQDVVVVDNDISGAVGPEVRFIQRLKSKARLTIRFNSGKITPEIIELNKLSRECTSMMLALNAASKYGWDLLSSNVVKEEGLTVHHMYLRRKR